MKKKCLLFLLVLCFCTAVDSDESSPLVVGMELSYPPFEMMGPKGNPEGISVEIAKALGEYLKRAVVIDNIPFIGLIPSLQNGKIDLIISSMTVNKKRQRAIAFSEPYLATGLCLLVSLKSDLQSIEQANQKGRVIAVKAGTSGELYAAKHLDQATIVILDKEASAVLEVIQGKVDAFIYDQFSVFTHWQRHQTATRAILTPFKKEFWAVGLRKGNDALLKQVNAFLMQFKQKGGFEKLGNEYLRAQKEAFKEIGVPFIF